VAVCDQKYEESCTLDDGVRALRTYEELLEEPLDVLFVSLPSYMAADVTIAGLQRGLHVFCEKPPGRTVEDVERVIEVEERARDRVLKYGFNHRYHGSVKDSLDIIASGELGEVLNLRGVYGKSMIIPFSGGWRAERRYAGGGILLDQGIHILDLIRLFGGEFHEVKSFVTNNYWHHDVEDNAYALLRSDRGTIAMLHSSATQWHHMFSLEIALTDGYLVLQGILTGSKSYGEERLLKGRRIEESVRGTQREEVLVYLEDTSWRDEIDEFAEAVIDGAPIRHGSSADALRTMKLVYRIYCADPEWRDAFDLDCPRDEGRA
jgi:predicted dehydrogenase